jgi:hypothetical protein
MRKKRKAKTLYSFLTGGFMLPDGLVYPATAFQYL